MLESSPGQTHLELDSEEALLSGRRPWKGKRKFVLRPGLVSGNDECGGKSGGSLVQMDGLVIDYPEAAWLDFTCSVAA